MSSADKTVIFVLQSRVCFPERWRNKIFKLGDENGHMDVPASGDADPIIAIFRQFAVHEHEAHLISQRGEFESDF